MEQKSVVRIPSCATNVSDRSSVGLCGTLMTCKVFCLDLPRVVELFFRLSCAVIPTLRTIRSPGSISTVLLLSTLFWPDSSIVHVVCNCRLVILTFQSSYLSVSIICNNVWMFRIQSRHLYKIRGFQFELAFSADVI